MTGLAVTVRATMDEGPLASALASCDEVMAGTAGASLGVTIAWTVPFGVLAPESLWTLTMLARDR